MLSKIVNCCKILLICFVVISCGKSKEDEKLFEELNNSLENSNTIIKKKTEDCFRKLEADSQKPETREKATIWLAKARAVDSLSNKLIKDISSLQEQIKVANTIDKSLIEKLYSDLMLYKYELLQIDETILSNLEPIINSTKNKKDTSEMPVSLFVSGFNKPNSFLKMAMLKNKIEIIKEMVVEYCSQQYCVLICGMIDHLSFIASQNSTHFKPNEVLEIKAGIGIFSRNTMPNIYINNKKIKLNSEDIAEFKENVPIKPGTYKKLVKIEFTKPDGTLSAVEKEIIYTVDK